VASAETYIGDDGSKLNYWTRTKYLNVWVVKTISSGAAGYAYLPGTAPSASVDGIIILSTYVGSIGTGNASTSRALTHEVGHFLNLLHVWGSTNNPGVSCGNDGVTDTPVTKGWTSCNLTSNDICTANVEENVQNFLEYSYCSRMFTPGQKTRMRSALNATAGQRNQLLANSASVVNEPMNTCGPNADFGPYPPAYVCQGGSLIFTDASWNGRPTSWSWSFPGGTPSTSTDSIPVIQYNTPGNYAVTLTVSNGSGSDAITRNNHVIVASTTAQFQGTSYIESFENSSTFTTDWHVFNPSGNGFTRVTTAAVTGTASVKLTNTASLVGQKDELVSPTINLSAIASPVFTFKVAYAQRSTTDIDKLRVLVSLDCGRTWTQRYTKNGSLLSTASATNNAFTPNSAQWRTETVSLNSSITSSSNVRFKFEFTSDGGNNIYIEDINIIGATGIDPLNTNIANFDVFPNPAQDNTTVNFSLTEKQNVNLEVVDMTGRRVSLIQAGELQAGDYSFPLMGAGTLGRGMYMVRLITADGRAATRKLIVE
jgi:PKD repeat protein